MMTRRLIRISLSIAAFFMFSLDLSAQIADKECHVDYCYVTAGGYFMAHFGRWATPEQFVDGPTKQEMCLEDCNQSVFEVDSLVPKNKYLTEVSRKRFQDSLSSESILVRFQNDNVYLLDTKNSMAIKFNNELAKIWSHDLSGETEKVSDLLPSIDGGYWISDPYQRLIIKYSDEGSIEEKHEIPFQPVHLEKKSDQICIHPGGSISANGSSFSCFDENMSELISYVEQDQKLKRIGLGVSNVDLNLLASANNKSVIANNIFYGEMNILNNDNEVLTKFYIKNELFESPDFPIDFDFYSTLPKEYFDSIVYRIMTVKNHILVLMIEHESGDKFLDVYNMNGVREIGSVIPIGKHFPMGISPDNYFYSLLKSESGDKYLVQYELPKILR